MKASYTQISQDKAREMMAEGGCIILDVRRQDEYEEAHIPGAICVPNESIAAEKPAELPDLDQAILVYCRTGRRSKEASQKLADIGYTKIYEFGGITEWTGETVRGNKPYGEEQRTAEPSPVLVIDTGSRKFYANLEDNSSAKVFAEKLSKEPVTVSMHDYGSFEKVGDLPWSLPRNDTQITTSPGDVILYQGNQITIYYGTNSWSFTKLARIENTTREELLKALGSGNASVTFSVEWSE